MIEKHTTTSLKYEEDEDGVRRVVTDQRTTGATLRLGPIQIQVGSAIGQYEQHYKRLKRIYR